MKELIAIKGLEVICTDDNKKCIISQINSDSYYLDIHPDNEDTTGFGYTGRSANILDIKGLNGELIYHPNYIGSKKLEKDTYILVKFGSEVYTRIQSVFSRMREVNKIAFQLCEEFGGISYFKKPGMLAGGISAIKFENGKPSKDWKKVGSKYVIAYENAYMPAKKDSDNQKRINDLPVIEKSEMNDIYGFPTGQFIGNEISFMPGIEKIGNDYILDVSAGCIIAIKDGVSILSKSDYYKLKGE